ncbi:FAD-binding oxidoreductase [Rhodococcus sp. HNM0569]|uniref:NAD(P)/FAD-dependent oxidoreductase n=1 Tax=Rhodococcus sp. HNM0569 TaxID=2716340 RepID=UPI00146DE6B3|nr:FAD-binding oxidoreductase [Rhodococcus sp. HNM0569]NLU81353.1 FAD-binding oxidoreductase [Rhodococcus sp. HNM0569]
MTTSDVAVIGAGIVGLSTAYVLRRRGLSVALYEQGQPGFGQSAGQSRLFRHAHDDPRLIELAVESRRRWREWEREFDTDLVSDDGAVALGPAVERRLAGLRRFPTIGARALERHELRQWLPILGDVDVPAMLDPAGGSIRTRAAVTALADRLSDAVVAEPVLALDATDDGARVRSATRSASFRNVVVYAGRGTSALARTVGLDIPVSLSLHTRVSFRVRDAAARLAGLQDGGAFDDGLATYATAYPDRSVYAVGGGSVSSDDGPDGNAVAALVDRASHYVETALPGLDPAPVDYVHCWVTQLPWGDDVVAIWQSGPVFALAGNNLFKHAPSLGDVLADCVDTGAVPALFRPGSRLGRADAGE